MAMAFYFSLEFFWGFFTSLLPPFALALVIVSLLLSADQSNGSRETDFEQETRVGFVGKVEILDDSGEKSPVFQNPVSGSNESPEIAEEVTEDHPIDESPAVDEAQGGSSVGSATDLVEDEAGIVQSGEVSDDDWEGIERTELERVFAAAVSFVGSRRNADKISKLGGDLVVELFGLHKIATVGPCREPQPMVFKVSARAKWNAWKRLGNMNQDIAMERYIELLSRSIPRWLQDDTGGDNERDYAEMFPGSANQPVAADNRSLNELNGCIENFYPTKSAI